MLRRNTIFATCLLAGLFCAWPLVAGSAETKKKQSDSEKTHGLELRLQVSSKHEKGKDQHIIKLALHNKGEESIELHTNWKFENVDDERYALYMKVYSSFALSPKVFGYPPQTGGMPNRSSLQTREFLLPGESIETQWEFTSSSIWTRTYGFSTPPVGLYSIRAFHRVELASGEKLSLRSNEQPFVVGGSKEAPKGSYGKITEVSEDKATVTINLGTERKIEIGDHFVVPMMGGTDWLMTVVKVEEQQSVASVQRLRGRREFPSDRSSVLLISKKSAERLTARSAAPFPRRKPKPIKRPTRLPPMPQPRAASDKGDE